MSYMFRNCKSLVSLPDISNWVPRRPCSFRYAFENCKSLTKWPNIDKIRDQLGKIGEYNNTKDGEYDFDIFKGCDNLPSRCIIF